MFQISTKVSSIDFKKILKNAKRPRRWNDKMLIYDAYGVTLILFVKSINVEDGRLNLGLKYVVNETENGPFSKNKEDVKDRIVGDDTITISMSEDHYNEEVLRAKVKSSIKWCIFEAYRNMARTKDEYYEMQQLDYDVVHQAEIDAISHLDKLGVKEMSVREPYIKDMRGYAYMKTSNVTDYVGGFKCTERDQLINIIENTVEFV